MPRRSNRSRFEQLLDEWEPAMRAAFLAGVDDLTSKAAIGLIAERLERGDIEGALAAVNLDPAAFLELDRTIARTFDAGGIATVGAFPVLRDPSGARLVVRFDVRNPRAETWLRQHSSTLITRIFEDTRAGIRETLRGGLIAGRNPRSVALDIAGRVSRVTGTRTGGLIGLTGQQSSHVASARSELSSGDPAAMRNYLTRNRRDKRFDATVRKAIAAGVPVPADMISKMTGRYSDGLLALRGETIARTETIAALGQSQNEAMQQAIEQGKIEAGTVTKVWRTASDNRVRDSHAAMHGETVAFGDVFSNGLAFPGDPAGAPEETINCRCYLEQRVDFLAGIR